MKKLLLSVGLGCVVGCLPTIPPATSPPAPTRKADPRPFPVTQFVRELRESGRSPAAVEAPYLDREYTLRVRVDGWTTTGFALCSFADGGEGVVGIKLPDETKKGDTVRCVAVFGGYKAVSSAGVNYVFQFVRRVD